jgi:hypothetical protein
MASGEFTPEIYANMAVVGEWMKRNGKSIRGTRPLSRTESASAPATASLSSRYLFALTQFEKDGVYDDQMLPAADMTLTLKGVARPASVKLLGDGTALKYD